MEYLKKFNEKFFSFINKNEDWAKNISKNIDSLNDVDIDYKENDFIVGKIDSYFFFLDGKKYSIKRILSSMEYKYELFSGGFELKCSERIKKENFLKIKDIKNNKKESV